jgi:mercuric ion binding protein
MRFLRSAAIALLVLVTAAWITPKTITLSIPGMTCATCPITIKAALKKVPGVTDVTVSYEKLEAVVTFDDALTNTDALIKATTDAGYPSTVKPAKPAKPARDGSR